MNTIQVFKGNELLYTFLSSIVPPDGSYLWIDESTICYEIIALSYILNTRTKKMNVHIHVK